MAIDSTYLYVADYTGRTIRRINLTTAEVTTIAGLYATSGDTNATGTSARFYNPHSLCVTGTDLYITDYTRHVIRKMDLLTDSVTTFAGLAGTSGSTDGTGASARFYSPTGIACDGTDLYITEYNGHRLRHVDAGTAVVSNYAGTYGAASSTDAIGSNARFHYPNAVTVSGTDLYIGDGNYTVRKVVVATASVSTSAGSYASYGSTDGTATVAKFYGIFGVVVEGSYLYLTDYYNGSIRRMHLTTRVVDTFAGAPYAWGFADGVGTQARFNMIRDMVELDGMIYISELTNCTLRKLDPSSGLVSTVAGTAGACGSVDGIGTGTRLQGPSSLTTDGTYVYIADNTGHRIKRYNPTTNEVLTIAGSGSAGGDDGVGTLATFNLPRALAVVGDDLYVGDYTGQIIRKIDLSDFTVTTISGSYAVAGPDDGTGANARFNAPVDMLALDGSLYLLELTGGRIRKIDPATGDTTTVSGYYSGNSLHDGIGAATRYYQPNGLSTDGENLYVADYYNNAVRYVEIDGFLSHTLYGGAGLTYDAPQDGALAVSSIRYPYSVLWTSKGLYVANDYGIYLVE